MPEISVFGWFHTIIAIIGIGSGIYSLARYKVIQLTNLSGKIYLLCTLFAALSALAIYRHDGFGAAHALGVLTLVALLVGTIAAKTRVLGKLSAYVQAASYSGTLLFHMIPAITDGLMRLPVDGPVVTNIEDPLLKQFYLAFLVTFVVGFVLQSIWLFKRNHQA